MIKMIFTFYLTSVVIGQGVEFNQTCSETSLQAGAGCEENCNNERQVCLEPCLEPFDNDCLDGCTSTHLQCMRTCPCVTVGDCPLGCPCPSFPCDPACEVEVDIEPAQEMSLIDHSGLSFFKICMSDCMIQANETFNECIESSQEVTTQRVTTRSLTTPISFQSNRQLPPEENCKITSDELSIQCQLDCPCNQNCPSCSQPTDTCKVDYCPIETTTTTSTTETRSTTTAGQINDNSTTDAPSSLQLLASCPLLLVASSLITVY